jgi:vitamin B12 transporter
MAYGQTGQQVAAAGEPEQVVITGRIEEDLPRELAQLGTRVDTVTAADIKNGGFLDVGQSLQATVPGLYLVPKNGPFDYVDASFQGGRTEDILWTVDGVRINNRLYASTTPIDTLPASMIERIEVLEGPQALFYGTQAIAGAINVITKDFSETPDGAFAAGFDSNSGRHFDGFFRDTIDGHHFVVYGSSDVSDGYQPFRDQDYQPSQTDRNRSYNVLTIGGKYAYDFNDALRVTVSEQHTDAKLDYAYPNGRLTAFNDRNEDILSGKVDYRATDQLQLFLKGYYHWWYSYFTEIDNDVNPATGAITGVSVSDNHDFWGFTDYGATAMAKYMPTPGIETYLGYDYQNYNGRDVVLVIEPKTEHVHAIFGEVATTHDLIPNAQFAAGFRYNDPSMGQSALVWNVNGRWDVMPELFVKGMVGTAFRLPTAEELFANDPNDERGNPNLKPVTSTNVNASIGGTITQNVHWEVVGFYRDVKNLIDFVDFDPITNQDVFGNVPGTVKVRGGEFILDAALNDDLSGSFSYTYSQSHDSTGQQINRVPEQLVKALVDYHPMNQFFGFSASVNYVGSVFDTPIGSRENYGNYWVVDLGARVFFDRDRHHRVDFNIRNVFDQEYATRLSHGTTDLGGNAYSVWNLGLPRTFQVRYTYSFF